MATGKRKTRRRGPSESKTSRRRLAARDRRLEALELRRRGATYEVIAAELGFSGRGAAYKCVMTALRELEEEPAKEVLKLELQRLDAWLLALARKIDSGDVQAIGAALRASARRAALLGLDAPPPPKADSEKPPDAERYRLVTLPTVAEGQPARVALRVGEPEAARPWQGSGSPPGCRVEVLCPPGAELPQTFAALCQRWPVVLVPTAP
ncbi:MAG: hypothetical protein JXR96_26985 [Deltaproteobacteria bacterium]|nr:hypothetical protein [Deltaproteobacteria bacterium]